MAKILVVEDNEMNLQLIKDIIEMMGHESLAAHNGEEGIELAFREKPDLILMDIQMPGINGLEATRRIKSDPSTSHIPIIALTAMAMKGDREKFLGEGCDDYISKPFRLHDVMGKIRRWLENAQGADS
jgi:CheY-like chemotaxis protein